MLTLNEPPDAPEWQVEARCGCPGDCSVCRVEPRVPSNVTLGAE